MYLFGVKFIFLFVMLTFVLNFIPNVGSIIAVLTVLFFTFITQGASNPLLVLGILLTAIQITLGNIIEPRLSGKHLELSPILILLSLFFLGAILGIAGALITVPLTSTIKIGLTSCKSTRYFGKLIN